MGIMERPIVTTLSDGSKYWEQKYDKFYLKAYIPKSEIDGEALNYTFRAPLLLVFEENRKTIEEAIKFADTTGLADIAKAADGAVLYIYPTNEDGWKGATVEMYQDLIAEVKMDPMYEDGIVSQTDFFTREFKGYFIRGAKFRTDIYSYGQSADYVATNLLRQIDGEFLWGPGDITPAMCSMENLSVMPKIERFDIGILSVGNSAEINKAFDKCENLLVKNQADYVADFKSFVRKFKMWCGNMETEPDFEAMNMTEVSGVTTVKTSPDNFGIYKDTKEHKVGYFAYYNNDIFDKGPAPLVVGFHGGGDSSMYLTFVAGWYEIAHKYGFLFVSLENHQNVPAEEVVQVIDHIKERFNVDEKRIYATGFSMGSGKTWDMYQEYPDIFAGMMPNSALFPVWTSVFGKPVKENINMTVAVPMFYSGGEKSHLPEIPFQADSALERIQYAAKVNKLTASFDMKYEDKDKWDEPMYCGKPDRVEVVHDEVRGSDLTIRYYNSEDGVCRTAFASISGQIHECRQHTCENAWKFISQFTKE